LRSPQQFGQHLIGALALGLRDMDVGQHALDRVAARKVQGEFVSLAGFGLGLDRHRGLRQLQLAQLDRRRWVRFGQLDAADQLRWPRQLDRQRDKRKACANQGGATEGERRQARRHKGHAGIITRYCNRLDDFSRV
jgi:hypothetical protein